ncbi:aminoglycoside phosphotransferase family protein [Oceanotoga sp. DSM 15011]|uniref:aminoglycoside phosphotransferase family protein n=1 Tax=Oceanotoga sp. DSM 15011 TaxID=2984951 RepID=UPI0021F4587A|nr:aminoglycoside phosphotransferase family protein [Oceanotoga sp. DSM 15011]UYO99362.1 aminoglycoside phosphotransferase family protein [Oceanotoga sp. DSM 15011]
MLNDSNVCLEIDEVKLNNIIYNFLGSKSIIKKSYILNGGFFNTTYYVETTNPSKKMIIRIAPENKELLFEYEKNMISIESSIYKKMSDMGIPTSKVIYEDMSKKIIPREYLIIEYIDSISMNKIELNNLQKDRLNEQLGYYTEKIHSIKSNKFGWPSKNDELKKYDDWYDFLIAYTFEIKNKIEKYDIFDKSFTLDFEKSFIINKNLLQINKKPSLVHNDLWEPNILIDKDKNDNWNIKAIIDSDRVMYGDNEFEFVLWDMNESFKKGYKKDIDNTEKGIKRRLLYMLITATANAYIVKIQHNNIEGYNQCFNWAKDLLNKLNK